MSPASIDPRIAQGRLQQGLELLKNQQPLKALDLFDELLLERPNWPEVDAPRFEAAWRALHAAVNRSDWRHYDYLSRSVVANIRRGRSFVGETTLASPYMDGEVLLQTARNYCAGYAVPPPPAHRRPGAKIRLGFVGADFHQQATAYLLVGAIEKFDRQRFELRAYDFGPTQDSVLRQRSLRAYDAVVPIHELKDPQAAQRIFADGVDVLFHMRGIANGKLGLCAYRPAAIQIHYLYYPGTSGASFMDYIVADDFVIPPGHERFYAERVLRLPGCYQPNDARRSLPSALDRAAFGLPGPAVVMGNFSQNYKLVPDVFASWCALLRADDKRLLWLLGNDPAVQANLRREAATHGVAADRLRFSPPLATMDHLARLRACDLILDTYPYGGHTLTSDALWAGVPVVTQAGLTFASRVAGSLLRAVGLERLATSSREEYFTVADELLRRPQELRQMRAALEAGRAGFELFDSAAYARKLEAAILRAVEARWGRAA